MLLNTFNPQFFSVQETHYSKKGQFTQENFFVFEAIRKKEGGGSLWGVHVALKPVLISEHSDTIELLVVEIKAETKRIRIMTGYGHEDEVFQYS